jgi:UDP-N-acetylmuramate dehydrogenase
LPTAPERLSAWTTLRVGGPATRFVEARTAGELVEVVHDCDRRGEPVLLIAGGSNLVISDDGFSGTVVRVATSGIDIEKARDGSGYAVLVTAAAGEGWDRFVAAMVAQGYSGIETLSGIPGSVGATPVQNVGAYGTEVASVIESVEVYDRVEDRTYSMSAPECGFVYRNSVFKADLDRWLILAVTFRLERRPQSVALEYKDLAHTLGVSVGDTHEPAAVRRAVLAVRRSKGMVLDIDDVDTWSVGSFFTNPIVEPSQLARVPEDAPRWPVGDDRIKLSAAWLIEHAGFGRGHRVSPDAAASTSTKHTLAITNRGHARTEDIVALARMIRRGVFDAYGITLEPEPRLINTAL